MWVIRNRKLIFTLIVVIMLVAIGITATWGITLSVDFTGGSVIEGNYTASRPAIEDLNKAVAEAGFASTKIQPVGESSIIVKTKDLNTAERESLLGALRPLDPNGTNLFEETRVSTIGPSVGTELRTKAVLSIVLVLTLIIIFVAWAFRSVGKSVSSWKYGFAVILCLIHDVFVPVGVIAALSHFYIGYEVDTLFVTALLAILGYSVADTIVVFDRIRENLGRGGKESFEETVGRSLSETYGRSINTSLTTILAALAIFFFGGEATKHFALMLAVGIGAGTYSSILLASPLLVLISGQAKSGSK